MTSYWDYLRAKERYTSRFNIIGFGYSSSPWHPTKRCPVHPARRLVANCNLETGEPLPGLMCPECGMQFLDNEPTAQEEGLKPKHGKQETKIITAKSRKKYTDKQGNEINDEDLIAEIKRGANVIYYNEQKSGEETQIDTKNRRIIRSREKISK